MKSYRIDVSKVLNRGLFLVVAMGLSLATGLLSGCQNAVAAQGDPVIFEVYSVDSLEVLDISTPQIQLKTSSTVPTPCHAFSHIEVEQDDNEVTVKTFSQVDPGTVCIQVLGNIDADLTIDLVESGTYTLRFVGRSDTLETAITID